MQSFLLRNSFPQVIQLFPIIGKPDCSLNGMGEAFQLLRQRRQRCGLAVILNMPVINHRGADGFIVNKNDFRTERNPTFTEPKGTAPGFFPYFFSYLFVKSFPVLSRGFEIFAMLSSRLYASSADMA